MIYIYIYIYIPNFMKIGSGIEKSVWEHRDRSHKHVFIFFKLMKLGYKIVILLSMGG
jgi:hypothetical protein